MSSRFIHLQKNLAGLLKTGIPLIEFDGQNILPSLTFDDLGIYIIIPQISKLLNTPIQQSINLFFYGMATISFFVGIIGWHKVYTSRINQLIAFVAVALLTYKALRIGDVYLAYFFCVNTLTPWAIYYAQKKHYDNYFLLFLFFSGFLISFFHYIRAFSGLGVLFFLIFLFVTSLSLTRKQWMQSILALIIGSAIPVISFNSIYNQSLEFSKKSLPITPEKNHVFWHSIYLGFGFLQIFNPGIIYNDDAGVAKAQEIDPAVSLEKTKEYEAIIKNEVIKIIKNHWHFFILTIFAKLGILFMYFLEFANLGFFLALLFRKKWNLELSFFIALSFYGLFPLLTIPYPEYSLGFISCATMYGIISINYGLEQLLKNYYLKKATYLL
jgi:hypothetical protein